MRYQHLFLLIQQCIANYVLNILTTLIQHLDNLEYLYNLTILTVSTNYFLYEITLIILISMPQWMLDYRGSQDIWKCDTLLSLLMYYYIIQLNMYYIAARCSTEGDELYMAYRHQHIAQVSQ